MDIIGLIGDTNGVGFLDGDTFGLVTGTGLAVYSISRGPKDVIWRPQGVSAVASLPSLLLLAIAPDLASTEIEVLDFQSQIQVALLKPQSSGKVIQLSFGQDGSSLFGLSDFTDHAVFGWDMQTRNPFFHLKLTQLFTQCAVNPCDNSSFMLSNDEVIIFGAIKEVFGEHIPIMTSLESYTDGSIGNRITDRLTFLLWLPGHYALLCNEQTGELSVTNSQSNSVSSLGKVTNPSEPKRAYMPTSAVLSLNHLIVGTVAGDILWFEINLAKLVKVSFDGNISNIVNFTNPVQYLVAKGPVVSIVVNPKFDTCIATCFNSIMQFPTQPIDVVTVEGDDFGAEADVANTNILPRFPADQIKVHLDAQVGAVVASCSCAIPLIKSDKSIGVYHFFVTSSQSGDLSFWRIPIVAGDKSLGKSNIHPFLKVLTVQSDLRPSAYYTSMQFFYRNSDNAPYLVMGTNDGYFEVLRLFANEFDEEDYNPTERSPGTFEDEGILVGLQVVPLCSIRLFHQSVNVCAISDNGQYIGCGSTSSSDVFILRCGAAGMFSVLTQLSLGTSDQLASIQWDNPCVLLWLVTEGGSAKAFDVKSFALASSDSRPPVLIAALNSSKIISALPNIHGCLLLHSFDSYGFCKVNLPLKSDESFTASTTLPASEVILHGDMISAVSLSPCKTLLASGCIDGHLYLWKIYHDNMSKSALLSKSRVHRSPVLQISFSVDSSTLISGSSDGSIFIFKTDRLTEAKDAIFSKIDHQSNDRKEKGGLKREEKTWQETHTAAVEAGIRTKFDAKVNGIISGARAVMNRIVGLIDMNDARPDAEKLERHELVVDVEYEKIMRDNNEACKEACKADFDLKNSFQDILAARIRASCFDTMEVKTSQLLPFSHEGTNVVLASLPVREMSSLEKRTLDRIMRLRNIEVLAQKSSALGKLEKLKNGNMRASWVTSTTGCPSEIAWVMHEGLRWPSNKVLTKDEVELLRGNASTAGTGLITGGAVPNPDSDVVDEEDDTAGGHDFDGKNILNLLYSPLAIRTQVQKRIQIIMLKNVDRIFREKFNVEFSKLRSEKEDVIASIDSRNIRMNEILVELQVSESLYSPKFSDQEILKSTVQVLDDELTSRPYESESMRIAREREEAERKRRDEENQKQDVKGRALMDMMNGTLDVKKLISLGDSAAQMPEWMTTVPFAEMTELQKKEFEAFEEKQRLVQEEQIKYRKALEQELKKLKAEVTDVCKQFDDKLLVGLKLRVQIQQDLIAQELYIAKLASSIVHRDEYWASYLTARANLEATKAQGKDMRKKIASLQGKVDDLKQQANNSLEEEKALDKSFKKDIQTLCNATFDQETLRILTQLYRLRHISGDEEQPIDGDNGAGANDDMSKDVSKDNSKSSKQGSKLKGSKGDSTSMSKTATKASKVRPSKAMQSSEVKDVANLGPMQQAARALKDASSHDAKITNPFDIARSAVAKQKLGLIAQAILNVPLRMEDDCPDGFNIDQFTWSKLQELRSLRIEKEIHTQSKSQEFVKFKLQLDVLKADEFAIDQKMQHYREERDALKRKIDDLDSNIELLVNIRQGQDEVDADAMVSDYSDALLLPIAVVGRFNDQIRSLGREKIAVLNKIKTFRRKINLIDWEAHHLNLLRHFYEEYFTDIQLLRVTKDLQLVLREGSDAEMAKVKVEKIHARKEFLQKDADSKLAKLKRSKEGLLKQLEERQEETSKLESKILALTSQVHARTAIKQSRDLAKGVSGTVGATSAMKRMKTITSRRQLIDTARAQAEEIDFLRQELDKLRQKTFPSFVKATRTRTTAGL